MPMDFNAAIDKAMHNMLAHVNVSSDGLASRCAACKQSSCVVGALAENCARLLARQDS